MYLTKLWLGRNTSKEENNNEEKESPPLKKDRSTKDDEMEAGAQKNIKGGESDSVKRRKRRKVMKAKQYLDEEGFMGKGERFSPGEIGFSFKFFSHLSWYASFGTYWI